ncbi:hypothetical protein F5I97DRAFT_1902858 [Phlebopus sp. FC_14]|nr:hypothetical protein F5I97DRAFT_1902858 [Phlebopus sp. FC_14]
MSHPLFWRGRWFLYSTGNTSAVHLTESLPPEQHADILLLACGDPGHILYTIFANETKPSSLDPQKLDVTCCDIEPAVLARNALLFSLLADEGAEERLDSIWNIFYHLLLDQTSLSLLIEQCRKLVAAAQNLKSWREGPYSHFLFMCNEETLSSLRQLWSLYLGTADFDVRRAEQFKRAYLDGMKEVEQRHSGGYVLTSSRSAGPLAPLTLMAVSDQFRSFWSSGVTDDGSQKGKKASNVNPTLAFSLAGEKFAVHYGTDPVTGFHLAEVFASNVAALSAQPDTILAQKMVRAARNQFSRWCTAVIKLLKHGKSASSLAIRMFAGDALMFCQALQYTKVTGNAITPIHIAPWTFSTIEFDEYLYGEHARTTAPMSFDVIDTSNVLDHLGLLNILVTTIPLLHRSLSSTLYTEALLKLGNNPVQDIRQHLCGELSTISLLLGIVPSTLLSQFTTRSNLSESTIRSMDVSGATQYHERLAWKIMDGPATGLAGPEDIISLSFSPMQLSELLYGVYCAMFIDENVGRKFTMMSTSPAQMIRESSLCHYTRRSFAQFVYHIKSRVRTDWTQVMEKFDDKLQQDTNLILSSNFYQEMCCHFHLLGITTFESMGSPFIQSLRDRTLPQIFEGWSTVPAIVSVVLVVPRAAINAVAKELREAGTPGLQVNIKNSRLHNIFAHISAVFGSLQVTGLGESRRATIVEDQAGQYGSSSLIVSFSTPSISLMLSSKAMVGLGIRTTPSATAIFVPKLGLCQTVFEAQLEDIQRVHVLAERPRSNNCSAVDLSTEYSTQFTPPLAPERTINVHMDPSCTNINSFTVRVDITDSAAKASLAGGSVVAIEHVSTHKARLRIGMFEQIIGFPLPVDVSNAKLRIARKSMYVEIIAPMSLSTDVRGEQDITKKFHAFFERGRPTLWNIHRVNLDRCPPFKLSKKPNAFNWFVPHVSLMFSKRERAARSKRSPTANDTLINLKDTLHTLLLSVAGVEGRPPQFTFALYNTSTSETYAFIIVTALRLDIGSHTLLADAWIAPAMSVVQSKLNGAGFFQIVSIKTTADESAAWRHVLPLLTERCRTWSHKPSCEYLAQNSIPLFPGAGSDPEKSPFCSCGAGVGVDTLPKQFKVIAPYVTRAAFSPFFAVSYLEKVGIMGQDSEGGCKTCGNERGTLLVCGKCKNVQYCSRECQVKDWKAHKKNCI